MSNVVLSTVEVYPGVLQRYKAVIMLADVVFSTNNFIDEVETYKFEGEITPHFYPDKNAGGMATAISKTWYSVNVGDMAARCASPMVPFKFEKKMSDSNVIFAVWDPTIKEYYLSMDGILRNKKKGDEWQVTLGASLNVKQPLVELNQKGNPKPVLIKKEDKYGEGRTIKYLASSLVPEFLVIAKVKGVSATYGFFQIIRSASVENIGASENRGYKMDRAIDFEPESKDAIDFVKKDCKSGEQCEFFFMDIPGGKLDVGFASDYSKGAPACKTEPTMDTLILMKENKIIASFDLYLMMRVNSPNSLWVPVRKGTWGINYDFKCKEEDGCWEAHEEEWENDGSVEGTSFSLDENWLQKPVPPDWLGMALHERSVDLFDNGDFVGSWACGFRSLVEKTASDLCGSVVGEI